MNRALILLLTVMLFCPNSLAATMVCFTPDHNCEAALVKTLENATTSIDIAMYQLNLPSVTNLLIEKSKKIRVRVITDQERAQDKHSKIGSLIQNGIQVRFGKQENHMHHKFAVIDEKILLTGSFNYTKNAAQKNQENLLGLTDPEVTRKYRQQFEKVWNLSTTTQ